VPSTATVENAMITVALIPGRSRRSTEHQHAFGMILHPDLKVDAIGPNIDVVPNREIACQRSYSPCHSPVSRVITEGERFGASLPSRAESAS
jgi:hypothetical protein